MASATALVGSASSVARDTGDVAWTNASNVTTEDANAATATVSGFNATTAYLKATLAAGAFSIPSDARVDGIEISYSADTDGGTGQVFEERAAHFVCGGDQTGRDLWASTNIDSTQATLTKGSSTENWGVTLNPGALNDGGLGILLQFERFGSSNKTVRVYWVKVTVYYTASVGTPYRDAGDFGICVMDVPGAAGNISSYTFKFPGLGTPKFCLFAQAFVNRADMTAGTDDLVTRSRVYHNLGFGFSSTVHYSAEDSMQSGSVAGSRRSVTNATSSPAGGFVVEHAGAQFIDFDGFGVDSVNVSRNAQLNSDIRVVCVAFGGSGLSASAASDQTGLNAQPSATFDETGVGFEPDLVGLISGLENPASGQHAVYGGRNASFCQNTGSAFNNYHAHTSHRYKDQSGGSALTDVANTVRVGNDQAHMNVNWGDVGGSGEQYNWTITTPDSQGFTIEATGGDGRGEDGSGWFALKFGAGTAFQAGTFETPTSTGSQSPSFSPAIGFKPSAMIQYWTLASSLNTRKNDTSEGDAWVTTFVRDNIQVSLGLTNQNGAVGNVRSHIAEGSLLVYAGDQTEAIDASFTQFKSGGYDANFSTADATARKGVFLAMGSSSSFQPAWASQINQHIGLGAA